MTSLRTSRLTWALTLAFSACVATYTTRDATAQKPTPCTPRSQLVGRDTLLRILPCKDPGTLAPFFRASVDEMLGRQRAGNWPPDLFEAMRSQERQDHLCSYGRSRPGPIVTKACGPWATVHMFGLAVDVIHATKRWDHPRFFYWQMMHCQAVGLVCGYSWTKFPDAPHVQVGVWEGAPPAWAKAMAARGQLDSVWILVEREVRARRAKAAQPAQAARPATKRAA